MPGGLLVSKADVVECRRAFDHVGFFLLKAWVFL
jgi:hypothetical protein